CARAGSALSVTGRVAPGNRHADETRRACRIAAGGVVDADSCSSHAARESRRLAPAARRAANGKSGRSNRRQLFAAACLHWAVTWLASSRSRFPRKAGKSASQVVGEVAPLDEPFVGHSTTAG